VIRLSGTKLQSPSGLPFADGSSKDKAFQYMKTIVTGGTGFIGSALVRKLLEKEADVRMLVSPHRDTSQLRHLDVEIIRGDVRDYESLLKAFKGGKTLYHRSDLKGSRLQISNLNSVDP
jgi:FlaA1/EpsC-like NDP-sugar epimerase